MNEVGMRVALERDAWGEGVCIPGKKSRSKPTSGTSIARVIAEVERFGRKDEPLDA